MRTKSENFCWCSFFCITIFIKEFNYSFNETFVYNILKENSEYIKYFELKSLDKLLVFS